MTTRIGTILSIWLCSALLVCAQLTPALSRDDLDAAQCVAYDGDQPLGPAPVETLAALLGLQPGAGEWSTGVAKSTVRHFRIAFTHPIALGTLCTSYAGASKVFWFGVNLDRVVYYLKPDAPYPGDVAKDEQWVKLPNGMVKTLPPGVTVRALRFTEAYTSPVATPSPGYQTPPTTLGPVLLLKERYYDAIALGTSKLLPQPKKAPDWWVGLWSKPQTMDGAVFFTDRPDCLAKLEFLKADTTEFPLFAPAERWKSLAEPLGDGGARIIRFANTVTTRALRVCVSKGGIDFAYNIPHVLVLAHLDDAQEPPTAGIPPAPFKFSYEMPMDGFIAIDIKEKATGKHLRRLIAEVPRGKGTINEAWDLKDDYGQYVPPGEYAWTAVARPPLKLTYENTVNNAGHPPWWAPVRGGGSWMADESPPACVGTIDGNTMLMGSVVCESGQVAIATDLEGNKLWGESPVLTAWGGGYRVAGDGRYGYIVNSYGIERVDPQQKEFDPHEILKFRFTVDVPGGAFGGGDLGGAAAKGDRLYISYHAPTIPWLISSPLEEQFDLKKCMPMVRKSREYKESEYDDFARFYSTFQVGAAPSSQAAYYGDTSANAPKDGPLTVVFTKPIPIGSILLPDAGIKVYALKPGEKLPSEEPEGSEPDVLGGGGGGNDAEDKFDEAYWTLLTTEGKPGKPGIAVANGKGFSTQALRYKAQHFPYSLIMSRRFRDLAPDAERVYAEGEATEHNGWKVSRPGKPPISVENPSRMAMVWPQVVSLRGVSFHMPTTASMSVDSWIGPADADPKAALDDDKQWKEVGKYQVGIFGGYWAQTATVRTVDFGDQVSTRALRFRATLAAGVLGPQGFTSAVKGPQIAGFDAVVAYSYLGGDPDGLPPPLNERITEIKLPGGATDKAEVVGHIPFTKPGYLALDRKGDLYGVSDGAVVKIPLPLDAAHAPVVVLPKGKVEKPAGMAFDADNLLYIVDQGPQVIKVFNLETGELLRTIGTPGGMKVGPWDPNRLDAPEGIAIDGAGKLWLAETSLQPKRMSRWSRDGKLEKYFLGPTNYGQSGFYSGSGWLDSHDRSLLYYDGMKFVIDWQTKGWKLDSILYRPGINGPERSAAPNRPVYYQGHRYLVGDPQVYHEIAVISTERDGVAHVLVAAGELAMWKDIDKYSELHKKISGLERERYGFIWTDINGDGIPQPDEVQLTTKKTLAPTYDACRVGEDLSLNFSGVRIRPTGVRADGVPLYDLDKLETVPLLNNASWTTADGRAFVLGNHLLDAAGTTKLWAYPDDHLGVGGSRSVPYDRPTGLLVGEIAVLGHFTAGGEELFVTNGNHGDWYVFTADGLLASCIFGGPTGYGRRHWTMPECEPGKTDLSDLRMDEEHFFGSVVKAEDNNIYALAGHNHLSLVRVDGLESLKRLNGATTISKDDLDKTKTWEIAKAAAERAVQEPKVAKMPYTEEGGITVDGSIDEWGDALFMPIHQYYDEPNKKTVTDQRAALAFNTDHLFVAAEIADDSPMMNTADNLQTLFKHGDAVDVTLGVDAAASPTREHPVEGDIRILISQVNDKPVAVVFRYVSPETPRDKRVRYYSDAGGEVWVDQVHEVEGAEIVIKPGLKGYVLEASLPWKSLGVPPPKIDTKIRGDVGVLFGDENGLRTIERRYWAAKNQTVVADVPTEVRATPALWGELYVVDADPAVHFGPDAGGDAP